MKKYFAFFIAIGIISISMQVSAREMPIKIKNGMSYIQARKILLNAGWQNVPAHTTPNGTPVCAESLANSKACKYVEIEDCSGSGMGFCKMKFFDGEKTYLSITTEGGAPPEAVIHSWRKVKK